MNINFYKEYICPFCNDFFDNPRECGYCHQNYCLLCVEKIKLFNGKCLKCEKSIKKNIFENKYLISSLERIKFFCPDCGKMYQKYHEFNEHIKTPHNNNYKCKICFFATNNEKNFIDHLLLCHKLDLLSIMNSNSFYNKNLENNSLNNNDNNNINPISSNIIENNMKLSHSFHFGNSVNSNYSINNIESGSYVEQENVNNINDNFINHIQNVNQNNNNNNNNTIMSTKMDTDNSFKNSNNDYNNN